MPNDQLWFYHPEMQKRIAEAESDAREGRSTRLATPEDVRAELDALKSG
ncbi:MAG: hypothetical protein Q8N53_08740 [Longimicrobiales bacterium]|nr:hypothetical protein [Longimicrobiales bacterium]